jgi:hypothetical protein
MKKKAVCYQSDMGCEEDKCYCDPTPTRSIGKGIMQELAEINSLVKELKELARKNRYHG